MSRVKSRNILISLILILISFFAFGCGKKTPVDDIYFKLEGDQEQIVLLLGQTLDLDDFIYVAPTYADNKDYSITSYDSSIVGVEGNSIKALKQGDTYIKVISDDNDKKQDVIAVSVKESEEFLSSPQGLTYNAATQTLTFSNVANAVNYTLKVNGKEYSLGNSTSFNLKDCENPYNKVLTVQVKANAASYSKVFKNSAYSDEFKLFQSDDAKDVRVVGGKLYFSKPETSDAEIYLGNDLIDLITTSTTSVIVDLNSLPEVYAGTNQQLKIALKVKQSIIDSVYADVYADSNISSTSVDVMDSPSVTMNASTVTWNNVAGADEYEIYINGNLAATSVENSFNLEELADYESYVNSINNYELRVEAVNPINSVGILKTVKTNEILFNRLNTPTVALTSTGVQWNAIDNASVYAVTIKHGGNETTIATNATSLSFENYEHGEYSVYIKSLAAESSGVYYLSSLVSESDKKTFSKYEAAQIDVENYVLKITTLSTESYVVDIDGTVVSSSDYVVSANKIEITLKDKTFTAGEHLISVVRKGDNLTTIDSNVSTHDFMQLEEISTVTIANNVVSVVRSSYNENAIIRLQTTGGDLSQPKTTELLSMEFNTVDELAEHYLKAGAYITKVYVLGDGRKTFSCYPNNETKETGSVEFTVLAAPTISFTDSSKAQFSFSDTNNLTGATYSVYRDGSCERDDHSSMLYDFELLSGSVTYRVQANGNDGNILSSALSDEATFTRLTKPVLTFNNETNVISLTDNNASGVTDGYSISNNGAEVVGYNFVDPFNAFVEGDNIISVYACSILGEDGNYYLNSSEETLELYKVKKDSEITIGTDNLLKIAPAEYDNNYNIRVLIHVGGEDLEFNVEGANLVCEEYSLPLTIQSETYVIDLLDNQYNPIIDKLISDFEIKVRYISKTTGNVKFISSDYTDAKTIKLETKTSLTREAQTLKIANVNQAYTYVNYSLIINNTFKLDLDDTIVNYNGYVIVPINYIYDNVASLQEINTVAVLTKNLNTTNDVPMLSVKGESVSVMLQKAVNLTTYKYNSNEDGKNNNSAVVEFEAENTTYAKTYVVTITDGTNKIIRNYTYADAVLDLINFNMDGINLEGIITISAQVLTEGQTSAGVYVFNSVVSNELQFTKILAPINIYVADKTLHFDTVEYAAGYEVYKIQGTEHIKLNTSLITTNSYLLEDCPGELTLVLKSISQSGGYTNSSYGAQFKINKPNKVEALVENGLLAITLSNEVVGLLNEDIEVYLVAENKNGTVAQFYLNELKENGKISATNKLYIQPADVLAYSNTTRLEAEDVTFSYDINYKLTDKSSYFYVDSDSSKISVVGLFAVSKVEKTTSNNDTVELIKWYPSEYNVWKSQVLAVKYELMVVTNVDGVMYTSNDPNLKYYDGTAGEYLSYGEITTTSVVFPAGYDANNDGVLDVEFNSGLVTIYIKTVPAETIDDAGLCCSVYSTTLAIEFLSIPELTVNNGNLYWPALTNATEYILNIYTKDGTTPILTDVSSTNSYSLDTLTNTGLLEVTIKAISSKDHVLNSATSSRLIVYRLKKAVSVDVVAGHLVLGTNLYFTSAEIEFRDTQSGMIRYATAYNSSIDEQMALLGISSWSEAVSTTMLSQTFYLGIDLTEHLTGGRAYTVAIKLIGNTDTALGIISSEKTPDNLSELTIVKLHQVVTKVEYGVLSFEMNEAYTDSSTGLVNVNFNYVINNVSKAEDFWKNISLYHIKLLHAESETSMLAVDYESFINAQSVLTDYVIVNKNDLYAYIKYYYDTDEYVILNVFKNNQINLRDNDLLYYYETEVDVNAFTSNTEEQCIDLAAGGSFAIDIKVLGGNDFTSGGLKRGYATSFYSNLKTFVRYGSNVLATEKGVVAFTDLKAMDGINVIDYPVYRLTVTPLNQASLMKVVYMYYPDKLNEARAVATRYDSTTVDSALFVEIETSASKALLFNLSEYFGAGNYHVDIITLAGLGSGAADEVHYLLNANISGKYTYQKFNETKFYIQNGYLEFNLAYVSQVTGKIYANEYDITITNTTTGDSKSVTIDSTSEGVTILNNKLTYNIPRDIDGFIVEENYTYEIKVKARSSMNYLLNGSYLSVSGSDYLFSFSKAKKPVTQIQNGVLTWDASGYEENAEFVIQVSSSFGGGRKVFYTTTQGVAVYDEYGTYLYHSYDLKGVYENETTPNIYVTSNGGPYTISLYVTGSGNMINSDYSDAVTTRRVETVDIATIQTHNGELVWTAVDRAVGYIVNIVGSETYTYFATTNRLDLLSITDESGKMLAVGNYAVNIMAVGSNNLTAFVSEDVTGFEKLQQTTSITIEGSNIVWATVPKAKAYNITFIYKNGDGIDINNTYTTTETYYQAPNDIDGQFTVKIQAISVDYGKEFNGDVLSWTSSSEIPESVNAIIYDAENLRYIWTVSDDFLDTDRLLVKYQVREYISETEFKSAVSKMETILFKQEGYYYEDGGTTYYYYPLKLIGRYENFTVQVARDGTVDSNAVKGADVVFKIYSYGDGSESNPYRLANATHLLNIKYFTTSSTYFEFSNDISLNIESCETPYIIADEFNGIIDAKGYAIQHFGIVNTEDSTDTLELTDITTFALFNKLNGAKIYNLAIGGRDQSLIIKNTFTTKSSENVKFAILAINATNTTVNNLNIRNLTFEFKESAQNSLSGNLYLASMFVNAENCTISNTISIFTFNNSASFTSAAYSYVAGLVAQAKDTNFTSIKRMNGNAAEAGVEFKITNTKDFVIDYIGGVVANYEGNRNQTKGFTDVYVDINIKKVYSTYLGGIIGSATYAVIDGCNASGSITYTNLGLQVYIGGLIASAVDTNIQNSKVSTTFSITLANTSNKYIGAVVGKIVKSDSYCTTQIVNCKTTFAVVDRTIVAQPITIGIYGEIGSGVSCSNCGQI